MTRKRARSPGASILQQIVELYLERDRGPITISDFADRYSKTYLWSVFSRLQKQGLLRRHVRGNYYVNENHPVIRRILAKQPHRGVSLFGGGVGGDVWGVVVGGDGVGLVHDVKLVFWVGVDVYGLVCGRGDGFRLEGWRFDGRNRGWFVPRFTWSGRARWCSAVFYPTGAVVVEVKCADDPIEVSFQGFWELENFLSDFRAARIVEPLIRVGKLTVAEGNKIPPVTEWRVVEWHYGKDSPLGESGVWLPPTSQMTFINWAGEYVRHYGRDIQGVPVVRTEAIQRPHEKTGILFPQLAYQSESLKKIEQAVERIQQAVDMLDKKTEKQLEKIAEGLNNIAKFFEKITGSESSEETRIETSKTNYIT